LVFVARTIPRTLAGRYWKILVVRETCHRMAGLELRAEPDLDCHTSKAASRTAGPSANFSAATEANERLQSDLPRRAVGRAGRSCDTRLATHVGEGYVSDPSKWKPLSPDSLRKYERGSLARYIISKSATPLRLCYTNWGVFLRLTSPTVKRPRRDIMTNLPTRVGNR
jgi:hypothetical protein